MELGFTTDFKNIDTNLVDLLKIVFEVFWNVEKTFSQALYKQRMN